MDIKCNDLKQARPSSAIADAEKLGPTFLFFFLHKERGKKETETGRQGEQQMRYMKTISTFLW